MKLNLKLYLIRELAKEKKITLVTVANSVGMTYSNLQKIMKDGSTTEKTVNKICNFFNIDIEYFLTEGYKKENKVEEIVDEKEENSKKQQQIIDVLLKSMENLNSLLDEYKRKLKDIEERDFVENKKKVAS